MAVLAFDRAVRGHGRHEMSNCASCPVRCRAICEGLDVEKVEAAHCRSAPRRGHGGL